MALVPGHDHDVFVSYAHADNTLSYGSEAALGWVTALVQNLNRGPNVAAKEIFIDHQLQPGDAFSEDLLKKVERSALLLILLSQNYLKSKWCGQEIAHFIRTHADNPEQPRDVFVVELWPFERLKDIPSAIENLRKHLIHAKFWFHPAADAMPRLAGDPSPAECKDDGGLYWRQRDSLRSALDKRLSELAAEPRSAARTSVSITLPGVLLAEVTDDLETRRDEVKIALEKENIGVLPVADYVGLKLAEFEKAIGSDIGKSLLYVQLLSPTAGRRPQGSDKPLPQLQFARAQAANLPVMQWCEQMPSPEAIRDPNHRALFNTPFLQVVNLERFKEEVIHRFRDLDHARRAAIAKPPEQKRFVFIDDACGEGELNRVIRDIIKRQRCEIRSLPENAPLGHNGFALGECLKPCRGALTVYSNRRTQLTVAHRLAYFINQVAEEQIPLSRWGIYLGPEVQDADVVREFGIDSEEIIPIRGDEAVNETALIEFLRSL